MLKYFELQLRDHFLKKSRWRYIYKTQKEIMPAMDKGLIWSKQFLKAFLEFWF